MLVLINLLYFAGQTILIVSKKQKAKNVLFILVLTEREGQIRSYCIAAERILLWMEERDRERKNMSIKETARLECYATYVVR